MAARLIRGPERHDSASLRVTTAPYALLMTITPLKYFRRWGGGGGGSSRPVARKDRSAEPGIQSNASMGAGACSFRTTVADR